MNGHTRRGLAALIIAACLTCAGCEAETPQAETTTGNTTDTAQHGTGNVPSCDHIGSYSDVTECELKLHDGTHVTCAVMYASGGTGGLSCDWEHATGNETK